ncbi:hypothetical protein [Planococcus faecalis]|nr:hypothetical protein [Planococcus faecalis]
MGSVKVNNLIKSFGSFTALQNIDLDIKEGEFFALLGLRGVEKRR